jgi:hypothetical protein
MNDYQYQDFAIGGMDIMGARLLAGTTIMAVLAASGFA